MALDDRGDPAGSEGDYEALTADEPPSPVPLSSPLAALQEEGDVGGTTPGTRARPHLHAHAHAHHAVGNPLWHGTYVEGHLRVVGTRSAEGDGPACAASAHPARSPPGLRVRRRAVWIFFLACAAVTLVLSSTCDGIIEQYDGLAYLHYSAAGDYSTDTAPWDALAPAAEGQRVGYECTDRPRSEGPGPGEDALESSLALLVVTPFVCFSALAAGSFLSCRGGCATATPTCRLPECSVAGLVGAAHKATVAIVLLCVLLWSSHLGLMSEIKGACQLENSGGYTPEGTYAERGFKGALSWNGTAGEGVQRGVLVEAYFVSYAETRSLKLGTPGVGAEHHLYGGAIGAAVLGALGLLLQIPIILFSERAISQKVAAAAAAQGGDGDGFARTPAVPLYSPYSLLSYERGAPATPAMFHTPAPSALPAGGRSYLRNVSMETQPDDDR